MTDDRDRIGRGILEQLEYYRSLGVRWARTSPTSRSSEPRASTARERAQPRVVPPAGEGLIFIPQTATMFDPIPAQDESLEAIRQDLGDCKRCKLAPDRKHIVFGSGNPKAELMFVGEAPGADEDEQGLPFVGRAGQLLTRIIEAIDMRRSDVYICNILKCRPPGNRNPEGDEIKSCEPFLLRQIASIRPRVICALGTFGAQTLLGTKEPISKLRGRFIEYRGAKLMATFHPAYLLRNPNEKRRVWEDVQKIRDYLKSMRAQT